MNFLARNNREGEWLRARTRPVVDLEDKESAPVKTWEGAISALALVPVVIFLIQRNLVFSDGRYGLFESDLLPLFLMILAGSVILLIGKPWHSVSKFGSPLRWTALQMRCLMNVFRQP